MLNAGKRNVLGILISVADYEGAVDAIARAARERIGTAISALAVHGLMTGVFDREQKFRLNHFDLLVPDGQPVRWVLNWLYRAGLPDRVYGPNLTLQEAFAFEFRDHLQMPTLAVGAAFPFLAGIVPQAPGWMQDAGLEWLFRLVAEPRRLWRRYLFLNPAYLFLVALQAFGISRFSTEGRSPTHELLYG